MGVIPAALSDSRLGELESSGGMDAVSARHQREEGPDARGWDLSRAVLGDRVGTSHGEGLRWVDADGGSIAAIARRHCDVSFVVGSGLGSPRAGRFAVVPNAPRGSLLPAAQGLLRSPASAVGVEEGESGI